MTFLNAIWAALALGLAPILIHLLMRQRYKKVDFPTLRFLRELQRQKMRQLRFRQILLLILRTLAVLFLVLAIMRPVLKSTAGILPGGQARTTAILILDRSASMQTETPDGTRFRQMQTRAQEILAALRDGDDAQIIWADDNPERFPEAPTAQIRLLREAIVDAHPTERGGNLVKAFQQARQSIGASQNLHKEVYVLSDLSLSAWPEKLPEAQLLPKDVRLFLLPAGGSAPRNIGVTEASIVSRIITPGRPVDVQFTVRNSGTAPATDRIVSVYAGGRRVAQTRVTLAPGEARQQDIRFVPDSPGDQVGSVRIEEADDFPADDQRNFVLRVPANLHVAVVGSDGPARTLTALALNPSADPASFVNVKVGTPAALESDDWTTLDAIVLVDAAGFSGNFPARLRSYVEGGKGVLIIPGPQTDMRESSAWLATLGLPSPGDVWQGPSAARWTHVDLQHPLFEGLFQEKPASISPDLSKIIRVAPTTTATEVIATSAGVPFLLEARAGRGRALLMTSSPDPSWSTLYRSGIFPPLMVSGVAYLSGIGTSGVDYQLTAGVPAQIQFNGAPGDQRFELRGDQTVSPAVESAPAGFQVKIPPLDKPGAYELWQGNRRLASVAVNTPPRESELQPAPESSYRNILGGQITFLGERANVQTAILEGRFGRELWKLCLYIALALLIAEMLIARVGKREVAPA
ncbi:MAG TPA: BatA domain-containing protein [bacterium]|jgi:hypothetical protein